MTIFEGDPKIILSIDGADIVYKGGQPVMDQGLENLALISLFTRRGWCGNALTSDPAEQIGSDFEEAVNQPITLQAVNDIRDAAEKAILSNDIFETADVVVGNPESNRIRAEIVISTKQGEKRRFILEKNGQSWILQHINPAYLRV